MLLSFYQLIEIAISHKKLYKILFYDLSSRHYSIARQHEITPK